MTKRLAWQGAAEPLIGLDFFAADLVVGNCRALIMLSFRFDELATLPVCGSDSSLGAMSDQSVLSINSCLCCSVIQSFATMTSLVSVAGLNSRICVGTPV